jgi:hypothetical protein
MVYNIIYYIIFLIIFTILVWYIEDMATKNMTSRAVEFEGQTIMVPGLDPFEGEPKMIKSNGSKLVCDTISEITGQKVKHNVSVGAGRSFLSRGMMVDCYEPHTGIMGDYIPREMNTYNGPDNFNRNIYDFYFRLAGHASKKDFISGTGKPYIEIPHTVDNCYRDENDELICKADVPEKVRRQRLKDYLKEKILISV